MLNKTENTGAGEVEPPRREGSMNRLKSALTLQAAGRASAGGHCSGGTLVMRQLGRFKDRCLIAGVVQPYSINDPHPAIGECPHGQALTFALRSLALRGEPRPPFLLDRSPRKLV